ncbi:hypothetical protein SAMN05444008_102128 [Cnuella takakiae]|uniref:Methylamine utilisation protein MauE domain-containing protein n=1 Tax=Cnuella takakiae TaxID=1302690 RepID=A0A1M4V487_9BACT|nr:BT_3928 family protein [Cnuella takakiae]OLY92714.1 hypothetical protein BUE76_13060 [Cnuella takakiae]SHE63698.1 hypothetical protein SAMN05444008_102128 [Cnuella takakiae]
MRPIITAARIFVGVLFIISGLVKANDPLGLSYKMQEFFEVWNSDLAASGFFAKGLLISLFNWLHGYSLALSILVITLEILAGVALLMGWARNAVLRLLLVLIIFFTFLTGYALWSGKFKNCGCFGDCLPITPGTSFGKDIVLLVLILALWWGRKYINPVASATARKAVLAGALVFTLGMQWYVLNYLPFADCLPYKVGNNINQQMQLPAGARPDSFAIQFVYEKGGKKYEFPVEALPADLETYTYVDRVDKLVRKGNAEPPIKGFALTGISGADSTQAILQLPKVLLVLSENLNKANNGWFEELKALHHQASQQKIPLMVITAASLTNTRSLLDSQGFANIPLFSLDFTAIRTAARTMPTVLYLEQGTIKGKYSYRQMEQAILKQ